MRKYACLDQVFISKRRLIELLYLFKFKDTQEFTKRDIGKINSPKATEICLRIFINRMLMRSLGGFIQPVRIYFINDTEVFSIPIYLLGKRYICLYLILYIFK